MLTFFYNYMRPLLERGMVYGAISPLYVAKKRDQVKYFYSEEEKNQNDINGWDLTFIKGLGELSAEQLHDSTMDMNNRKLIQYSIEDAEQAAQMFDILMGPDVGPRREYIEQHAKFVEVVV